MRNTVKFTAYFLLSLTTMGTTLAQASSTQTAIQNNPKIDFRTIHNIPKLKHAFIQYMLPRIKKVQSKILIQRSNLSYLEKKLIQKKLLNEVEKNYLLGLSKQYKVRYQKNNLLSTITILLPRVNTIPTDLVLAQAALESSWGRSRFAIHANNYFGKQCFTKGCGIIPRHRVKGGVQEVQIFSNATTSLQSYFNLLNSGKNFKYFRVLRQKIILRNKPLTGKELVHTLTRYSELKDGEYQKRIIATINNDDLYRYN